ncbi:RNA polymerase subunit sigma-70 [Leptospira idonii]|uniref:RNA polymerase subunit sigma-70 n=1 Tax=Leptospira idonii TaxID=1193500 RepID=A0A4R9M076_9LEPT|nr:RNA polymerase subunit sigma-70 [Leptospira idonii]TGN19175.1 RNA polymerase subunit sigma-70 [Leptospira idonii]
MEELRWKLPIWMVDRLRRRRKLSSDECSELRLTILETLPKIWNLSLAYQEENLLGFFVTYCFNLYRNLSRKNQETESKTNYLQLWKNDSSSHEMKLLLSEENRWEALSRLEKLPTFTCLAVCLKYDLPITGQRKKLLEWRLALFQREYSYFERLYSKKREIRMQKLNLLELRVLRYTRLLYELPNPDRRKWYLSKKEDWVQLRIRTLNRSFFSEREIALILGISRKQVRGHHMRGTQALQALFQDLLHCA